MHGLLFYIFFLIPFDALCGSFVWTLNQNLYAEHSKNLVMERRKISFNSVKILIVLLHTELIVMPLIEMELKINTKFFLLASTEESHIHHTYREYL